MIAVPRTAGDLRLNGDRVLNLGLWIVVMEGVNEIRNPDGVFGRQASFT